jgi:predicted metalloprotease with PDZ domain
VTKRNDVDTALSRVVTDVAAGSPAASAGLKAADRIADVDGAAASAPVLNDAINARKPGEKIKLHVVRDGAPIEVEVEVARNVKRTYRLAAAAGATAGQTAILDDWLRKGL